MTATDPQQLLDRIRQLLGPRLDELAGAHLHGEIPLTEAVLNTMIGERLRASDTPVAAAEVRVRPDGELFVRLTLRTSFLPAVIVGARIEQQPDVPRSAVLVLRWWLPGMGALAAVAGPVLGFLKAGPPWVTLDGQHVRVDLARLLREQGAEEILAYLASLRVATREGAVLVAFELRVAPGRGATEPAAR